MTYPHTKAQTEALNGFQAFLVGQIRPLLARGRQLHDSLVSLPHTENGVKMVSGSNKAPKDNATILLNSASKLAELLYDADRETLEAEFNVNLRSGTYY